MATILQLCYILYFSIGFGSKSYNFIQYYFKNYLITYVSPQFWINYRLKAVDIWKILVQKSFVFWLTKFSYLKFLKGIYENKTYWVEMWNLRLDHGFFCLVKHVMNKIVSLFLLLKCKHLAQNSSESYVKSYLMILWWL